MQKYTRSDAQSFYDAMIFNMDSIGKYMHEITLHQQQTPQVLKQKKLMQTQEDHSNPISALNVDSLKVDLVVIQTTCFEERRHSLSRDQLQKQLDKDEFQEDGSIAAFWGGKKPVQEVHLFKVYIDYGQSMTAAKSVAERTRHQRQYERRGNKRQMQTQESKIDTGLKHWMLIDIKLFMMKKAMAELPNFKKIFRKWDSTIALLSNLNIKIKSLKSGQHGQILNETSNKAKIEKEIDVLETMNIELEHSVVILRKENETLKLRLQRLKTVFANVALKNDLRKLKGNSVDTKFDKTSVLGKPVLPSLRNQSVVRQLNAFKSARAQMSKQRFASQVDDIGFLLIGLPAVYEKTSPRSDLRWKPMGRIFKSIGLSEPFSKVDSLDDVTENDVLITTLEQDVTRNIGDMEELHQLDRLECMGYYVDRPLCKNVINLKWLWKNKRDEENTVIRNKSRLVAKGICLKGRN
ncbi:hypothetical protein Tco_1345980 [Tanacetum coccineum]